MLTLISIICLGFILGMRHATDADHVIAVTTIVSRERKIGNAVGIGAFWGLGHTLTLLLVGGAIILFGLEISPRLGLGMEFSVGLMLILLGTWTVKTFRAPRPAAEPEPRLGKIPRALRPFAVGMVHGMAGSAALALMVVPMIRNPAWAVGYLAVFGVGTIAGMMCITLAVSLPFSYTANRSVTWQRGLGFAAGLVSLAFGTFMIYHIGITEGLLLK